MLRHDHRPTRRRRRRTVTALAAAGAALLAAAPALAHPGLSPSTVDGGAAVDLTLSMAHGCTQGEPPPPPGQEVSPTVLVAVQVPEGVRDVTPAEKDGWTLDVTTDAAGTVTELAWQVQPATDPVEAPTFELSATAYGDAGEELRWSVFQECEVGAYRWIGDGSDPADDPAVRLVVGSPARLPPAPSPTPTATATPSGTATPTATTTPSAAADADADATARPSEPAASPTPTSDPDVAASDGTLPAPDAEVEGRPGWLVGAAVLVALAVGVVLARRRGRSS